MRILYIIGLLLFSVTSIAGTSGAKTLNRPDRHRSAGFLHILPYKYFVKFSTEEKRAYIKTLREYIGQQESKWSGKEVGDANSQWKKFAAFFNIDEAHH